MKRKRTGADTSFGKGYPIGHPKPKRKKRRGTPCDRCGVIPAQGHKLTESIVADRAMKLCDTCANDRDLNAQKIAFRCSGVDRRVYEGMR